MQDRWRRRFLEVVMLGVGHPDDVIACLCWVSTLACVVAPGRPALCFGSFDRHCQLVLPSKSPTTGSRRAAHHSSQHRCPGCARGPTRKLQRTISACSAMAKLAMPTAPPVPLPNHGVRRRQAQPSTPQSCLVGSMMPHLFVAMIWGEAPACPLQPQCNIAVMGHGRLPE